MIPVSDRITHPLKNKGDKLTSVYRIAYEVVQFYCIFLQYLVVMVSVLQEQNHVKCELHRVVLNDLTDSDVSFIFVYQIMSKMNVLDEYGY